MTDKNPSVGRNGAQSEGARVVLSVRDAVVSFDGFHALDGVSVDLKTGEILALAGANGAGKSTLFNVLTGDVGLTSGEMVLNGSKYHPSGYREARRSGVFRVSQELCVFPNLTVAENVTLSPEVGVHRRGVMRFGEARARTARFLDELGVTGIDPQTRVDDLPLGKRQVVEIVRVLYQAAQSGIQNPVVLLDEPTAALTVRQVDFLVAQLDRLRGRAAVCLTSHRGRELLDLGDRCVVLRAGKVVAEGPCSAFSAQSLWELIAGEERQSIGSGRNSEHREASPTPSSGRAAGPRDASALMEVDGLVASEDCEPISFGVEAGEVLGLVSDGELASKVAQTLGGARRAVQGVLRVRGRVVRPSPKRFRRAGVQYVPGDRKEEGLLLGQAISWNATVGMLGAGQRQGRVLVRSPRRERAVAREVVDHYGLRVASVDDPVEALSGGTQQRLLFARSMAAEMSVLVMDRPTRGVDVAAKEQIYGLVEEAAQAGVACIMASDEIEDCVRCCDRILVLDGATGRVLKALRRGEEEFDADTIEAAIRSAANGSGERKQ